MKHKPFDFALAVVPHVSARVLQPQMGWSVALLMSSIALGMCVQDQAHGCGMAALSCTKAACADNQHGVMQTVNTSPDLATI
jgi:hypothetical protein